MSQMQQQPQVMSMVIGVEPYFYNYLLSMLNKKIVVQFNTNNLQGTLCNVHPDSIELRVHGMPFHIRMKEITWVTPAA